MDCDPAQIVYQLDRIADARNAGSDNTLAIIAIILSLVALLWQITLTIIRWPQVSVVMSRSAQTPIGQAPRYSFHVTAINTGAEAVTIVDAGIAPVSGNGALLASVAGFRENGDQPDVIGPTLPARLEAHGALTWTIPGTLIRAEGGPFRAYAARFQPLVPGRESPHRYSYSSTTESIAVDGEPS
ncbi:hypothetical protein ACPPVW_18125 [Leifsonia sp. McL0607]|uniref:hypothetical protein n=1 Tax=Leifsonia sp. McL0607 TaxID=3415672 RepID=UPI003CF61230